MTFFFRHLQPVLDGGHVYLAKPPLFELVNPADARQLSSSRTKTSWRRFWTKLIAEA